MFLIHAVMPVQSPDARVWGVEHEAHFFEPWNTKNRGSDRITKSHLRGFLQWPNLLPLQHIYLRFYPLPILPTWGLNL
jgi:hypothetical protein